MAESWRVKTSTARVTSGASDFRIYQQDATGHADIAVGGTYDDQVPDGRDFRVCVRMLRESDFAPVNPVMAEATMPGWTPADASGDRRWSHTFRRVPAGGLYEIQTRLFWQSADGDTCGRMGEIVHHLGVGDLWLVAGQSNASGTGRGVAEDGPELGVHVLKNNERWAVAVHPLNEPACGDHPNRDGCPHTSPYLKFAKLLRRELGYPIGLVQAAMAGSSLRMWHVAEDPQAPLWHNMVYCVRLAGGRVRGMVWYQGCSDGALSTEKDAWTYGPRFERFIELARLEFGDFPVITTQLNRWIDMVQPPEVQEGWTILREVQRQLARKMRGLCLVPALDLPLSDGIHNSAAANVILGERVARAALGFVYGREGVWKSPDARRAAQADDGRTVRIEFDDVTTALLMMGFGRKDFMVVDSRGAVKVSAATCSKNTVTLKLARPLEGAAVVHGAYGIDPEWTLRDQETNLPALGFYGLKVE